MDTKDKADIQMARIERVARGLAPDIVVLFDQNAPEGCIRFRMESRAGSVVAESDIIHSNEIVKWSDEELRRCIRTLAAGKI